MTSLSMGGWNQSAGARPEPDGVMTDDAPPPGGKRAPWRY